jgi:hypothetical protein
MRLMFGPAIACRNGLATAPGHGNLSKSKDNEIIIRIEP